MSHPILQKFFSATNERRLYDHFLQGTLMKPSLELLTVSSLFLKLRKSKLKTKMTMQFRTMRHLPSRVMFLVIRLYHRHKIIDSLQRPWRHLLITPCNVLSLFSNCWQLVLKFQSTLAMQHAWNFLIILENICGPTTIQGSPGV